MRIVKVNSAIGAVDWFRRESQTGSLKVLAGLRGAGKSTVVRMYRDDLRAKGVAPEDIVHLDFESAEMRGVTSHKNVIAMIRQKRGDRKTKLYLILDEVTALLDFVFLMGFLYALQNCDTLITTSNKRIASKAALGYFGDEISVCRMYASDGLRRTEHQLESLWAIAFVRDVLGGDILANASAVEKMMGYVSDHLGEVMSRRKISGVFKVGGHDVSPNTIGEYLRALEEAYLIEFVPIWDDFEECIVKNEGMRVFCTDLELRDIRYGVAPEDEEDRFAYNRRYLELISEYDKVYCLKTDAKFADFVVIKGGKAKVMKWKES